MSPAKKFAAGVRLGARAGGFTLLEVMLAFVLLATAMGLVIAMLSNGLRQVQQAQNATEASLYAQSLLDGLGVLEPIEPMAQDGEFDGGRYRYHLEIVEAADPAPRLELPSRVEPRQALDAPMLYRIGLSVRWGAGQPAQRVDFALLRARAPDAQAGATP
jgi:general secretion pathway protein I